MRTIKFNFLILILLIITLGCKDEFLLDSINYQPQMVVEGLISNEQEATIQISLTSPVNNIGRIPLEGCTVLIIEKLGSSEVLVESSPGIYSSSEGGMQGIIGNSYKLSIITQDGKEYNTEYQLMKEPVGIESIKVKLDYQERVGSDFMVPGYQFYLSTINAPSADNYFLWRLTETYKYVSDYELTRFYLGMKSFTEGDTVIWREITNDTLLDYYNSTVYTCWNTQLVNYVYTGKTGNLTIPKITNQSLHFVSTETKKLTQRYSFLLKQYTINEEAFYYWEGIEKQSTSQNFLVASQPYTITGNIRNMNDPNDLVLGYFTVASVSEKRIFVDRLNEPFYFNKGCLVITDPYQIKEKEEEGGQLFYVRGYLREVLLYDKSCLDCRSEGGTIKKPDFWIDK